MGERSWSGAVRHRGTRATSPGRTRIEGLELSPIKAVELEASRIPDVVSLAQGIPSFDTPEPIKRFVQERLSEDVCARYSVTPGLPRLRESIAETLRRDGMAYDPDGEILVTAGSIEAIAASLLALVETGDEVLVVSPTYASYIPAIRLAGAVPRFVPLAEDTNSTSIPRPSEDAVGRRTRASSCATQQSHRPSSGGADAADAEGRRARESHRHRDEVYKDFLYGEARIHSAATEVWARHRVLRVCSFSKAYAMTGWRVGFVHGPAPSSQRCSRSMTPWLPRPGGSAVCRRWLLELGAAQIAGFRAEFRRRRDAVIGRLVALPHVFDYQKPNATYFVCPRVNDTVRLARDSRRLAADILARAHVALVPGVAFGPTGESHLRLCYARPAADIHRAFDRLDDYFAGRPARATSPAPAAPGTPAIRGLGRRAGVAVLRHGARVHLARTRPRVIAIAGTQGKTVIKRAVAELLGRTLRVRSNPLSYNTAVGLPLAVLGCRVDTHRPARAAGEVAAALCSAYASRARVDVMVLELGVRAPGDMQAHLEVVRPDIVVVAPLAPSFSDDAGALSTLRREIDTLCRSGTASAVLVCTDDPFLAELAERTPAAVGFARDDVVSQADGLVLRVDGATWPVGLDVVGASQQRALSVAARAGRLLGVGDADIGAFLAG